MKTTRTTLTLAERLHALWRRLTGHGAEDKARKAALDAALARTGRPKAGAPPKGELSLAPDNASARPRARTGRGSGFNPYSSDAGYGKPRTWDDVDTRL